MSRYDSSAGAIFVAIAAVIATSELYATPLGWLAWTSGIGGVCLLISAGIRAWIGIADRSRPYR